MEGGGVSDREGADIFAADMVDAEASSEIARAFAGSSVLVTGASGYIGKMFLEKLLRASDGVRVNVMLRPKKGKDVATRFRELFDGPNMVPMKLANPRFVEQVSIVNGDCAHPDLGLDDADKRRLIDETEYVIHCAATVRFDEKIATAAHTNVRAVRDLVAMAKKMKKLRAFLHVSTAFAHCPRDTIDEKYYEPGIRAKDLLQLIDVVPEERLIKMTPGLIDPWPNTYVFTKAIAEDVIREEASDLPVAILRPSIVIGARREPIAGWIDSFYGPTGIFAGAAIGLIRSLHVVGSNVADLVPSDYVVNAGLAALWRTAADRASVNSASPPSPAEPPIYNFVSSPDAPITWTQLMRRLERDTPQVPSELQVWHYGLGLRSNYYHHMIAVFLLHTLPAHLVDFALRCLGKEPMLVKGYAKIARFSSVLSYFTTREWRFSNGNTARLWDALADADRRAFEFGMRGFSWDEYTHFYSRGVRVYLLKDPLDTVPKGRIKHYKLIVMHYALLAVLAFLFYKAAMFALARIGLF